MDDLGDKAGTFHFIYQGFLTMMQATISTCAIFRVQAVDVLNTQILNFAVCIWHYTLLGYTSP